METSEPIVRPMTMDDLDQVVEMEKLCFTIPWSRAGFEGELQSTATRYLVVEIDGQIVAYAGTWLALDEGHITNVAVHPDWRRKRLGRLVTESLLECCANLGTSFMTLEVRKTNLIAQKLYRSLGFYMIGVRKRYYEDNDEDALVMINEHIQKFRTEEL